MDRKQKQDVIEPRPRAVPKEQPSEQRRPSRPSTPPTFRDARTLEQGRDLKSK